MTEDLQRNLVILAPEIWLSGMALLLLLAGLFMRPRWGWVLMLLAVAVLGVAASLLGSVHWQEQTAMNGMFIDDGLSRYAKYLVLGSGMVALLMAWPYLTAHKIAHFEYPVLALLAVAGMMLMVSANNLLSLYMGLELQNLALYVLAAFNRDDRKSSEAGLKYFILGGLSSGLLLFGISLLYGASGVIDFAGLREFFTAQSAAAAPGAVVGLVFVLAALAFKVSAAPFHMWTPDVYEGAPTPVTGFFAAAPKIAALVLLARVLYGPLHGLASHWQPIMILLAVASMLLGSFGAIAQSNIKRLMGYSAIAHAGYALAGLATVSLDGVAGMLIYLTVYFLNVLGVFAVILALRRDGIAVEAMGDLAGLSRTRPLLAFAMALFMFSLAGVPPLAGFYGKFYVLMAAVRSGLYPLAVIGVLASAVAAYYYLRIVKLMYFDESQAPIDPVPEFNLRAIIGLASFYVVLFGFLPKPVIDLAQLAATGLFFRL